MVKSYRECLVPVQFSDMRIRPQPGPVNRIRLPKHGYIAQFHMISKEYGLRQSEPVFVTAEEALSRLDRRVKLEKKIRGI